MKLWQKTLICVSLSTAILSSILTIKWHNDAEAALCGTGFCCINDVFSAETSTGDEIMIVFTTCGSYSVSVYTDGVVIVSVCPNGGSCQFIYL